MYIQCVVSAGFQRPVQCCGPCPTSTSTTTTTTMNPYYARETWCPWGPLGSSLGILDWGAGMAYSNFTLSNLTDGGVYEIWFEHTLAATNYTNETKYWEPHDILRYDGQTYEHCATTTTSTTSTTTSTTWYTPAPPNCTDPNDPRSNWTNCTDYARYERWFLVVGTLFTSMGLYQPVSTYSVLCALGLYEPLNSTLRI